MFLEISQNSQENNCSRVSFLIKLQAWAQVFSCEFCEISKNIIFTEHLQETASFLKYLLLALHSMLILSNLYQGKEFWKYQKQPPEVFYEKRCSKIFCKIHS